MLSKKAAGSLYAMKKNMSQSVHPKGTMMVRMQARMLVNEPR